MLEENLIRWAREDRQKARKEGRVEGARKLLLRQLERRFGPLAPEIRRQVESISSARRLEAMADEILVAGSLRDLGLE